MTNRLCWILPLVAACGGPGGKPAPVLGNTPPAGGAGREDLFAALLVEGAAPRYAIETTTSVWDDTDPAADAGGSVVKTSRAEMTCRVTAVAAVAGGRGAWLACDLDPAALALPDATLTGAYVVTDAGLWRLRSPLAELTAADLSPDAMLLAAAPAAGEDRREDPGGEGGEVRKVQRAPDGAWCATRVSWSGDDYATVACFAPGKGLVRAGFHFGGGSTIDVEWTRVE